MHRRRAARPRGFDSLLSQDPNPGRCQLYSSAGSSKIKIRTSSCNKAQLAILMIPPSKSTGNIPSLVLLNFTVVRYYSGGGGRCYKKVRVFGLKTLFLKRFMVRSTTRTLIIDKNDHSAFTATDELSRTKLRTMRLL
jgi:hypothetical protein